MKSAQIQFCGRVLYIYGYKSFLPENNREFNESKKYSINPNHPKNKNSFPSFRCFCRALNLSKDSSLLWHDLACCYLSQMKSDPNANRRQLAEKCLAAAKQAIKLCPSTWVHWNMLTAVCMTEEVKNYALAQHCCVMAIDREPNNAIAWTNLGTLYLSLGTDVIKYYFVVFL